MEKLIPLLRNNTSDAVVKLPDKKTVVVPDIHGRPDFVRKVFEQYDDQWNIVFVGDILHREHREFWGKVQEALIYKSEDFDALMLEELDCSLGSLQLILEHGNNVTLLRGNHDDIEGSLVGHYGKYCNLLESRIFSESLKDLMPKVYAPLVLFLKRLPYLAVGSDFLVSHSIPESVIRNVRLNDPKSHIEFCWSDNTRYPNEDAWKTNALHFGKGTAKYWFIGHRPVRDGLLREHFVEGLTVVQNNHPDMHVVVEVVNGVYNAKVL